MFPRQAQPPHAECKCCRAPAPLFDLCDFNKNCSEHRGVFLPLSGIPIYYYRCPRCGFLFTTDFDGLTRDEFAKHVYNDDYLKIDPDYQSSRPALNARLVDHLFGGAKAAAGVLDYGGGSGALEKSLRQLGFTRVRTYDPFSPDYRERPAGTFPLVTSFEVVEHATDPLATFADAAALLDPGNGVLLFSTLVQPADIDKVKARWWYVGPRNGHVSLHTRQSLAQLLARLGLTCASANDNLHLAFRTLPDFARHLFPDGGGKKSLRPVPDGL